MFWSSLPLFSSFSSSPIYHQIPIFHIPNLITTVYSKPHHNHTLLLKKSDTLIFLLNFDTLILSLLSPLSLSLSALFSSKDASSGLLPCKFLDTHLIFLFMFSSSVSSSSSSFFSFFLFSLRLIFCYWTCSGRILHFGWISPKWTGMPKTHQNRPEFYPRWNRGVCHSGLHTDTKFSGHSGRNRTKLITMVQTTH